LRDIRAKPHPDVNSRLLLVNKFQTLTKMKAALPNFLLNFSLNLQMIFFEICFIKNFY